MDKIHRFIGRSEIEEEALDWLFRMDGDEPLTADEMVELSEWLSRSPAHRRELNSLNQFWGNNVLTELVVPLGEYGCEEEAEERQKGTRWWNSAGRGMAAAAMLVVGLAVSMGYWLMGDDYTDTNGLYMTAVGQQTTSTLADGSVVHLNTNSQIEVEYEDGFRNIRLLQGEVHFDVAKDPERPFRVYAGDGRVEAVGTAFTVHLSNQHVDVLVTEGKVAVAALEEPESTLSETAENNQHVVDVFAEAKTVTLGVLEAGQAVSVNDARQLVQTGATEAINEIVEVIANDELERRQSWRQGMLVFTGESLVEVVAEVSRFTTTTIEIADPELRDLQIGGRFPVGEVDEMLAILEANFGLEVKQQNHNRVLLTAAR